MTDGASSPAKDVAAELPDNTPTTNTAGGGRHRKQSSSLSDYTMLELDRQDDGEVEVVVNEQPEALTQIPTASLVVMTDTKVLQRQDSILKNVVADITDFDFTLEDGKFTVRDWTGIKGYSDYIRDGLEFNKTSTTGDESSLRNNRKKIVMLFESPSSSTDAHSFHNKTKFRFHDWPPPAKTGGKSVLGPCRYGLMNGTSFPVFLKDGAPPAGLVDHWQSAVPNFRAPSYVDTIKDDDTVYAYLPVEQIRNHVNDPDTHYHLAGKDAIHMMTQKTTTLLADTKSIRPCVVKTTHSMGSKGIFIIANDEDEKEFQQFLVDSGNPTYVITNFVDIARNVACHFFMHPNGSIVWFGSNENHREPNGSFSTDSYLIWEHQDKLKEIQLPFVEEVVQYCHGLGFWGFCGVDVLFDSRDRGYLVDINPRVTGSCPALMTLSLLVKEFHFSVGLFRRSGKTCFFGTEEELWTKVGAYNTDHEGKSRIVIHAYYQAPEKNYLRLNIGVYGTDMDDCKTVLNDFAKDLKENPNPQ